MSILGRGDGFSPNYERKKGFCLNFYVIFTLTRIHITRNNILGSGNEGKVIKRGTYYSTLDWLLRKGVGKGSYINFGVFAQYHDLFIVFSFANYLTSMLVGSSGAQRFFFYQKATLILRSCFAVVSDALSSLDFGHTMSTKVRKHLNNRATQYTMDCLFIHASFNSSLLDISI